MIQAFYKITRVCLRALVIILVTQIGSEITGGDAAWAKGKQVKKIKAPKAKHRPSLSFKPDTSRRTPKYTGKVGVLALRDRRGFKFYNGSDAFFAEPTLPALNDALYLGLKGGRVFSHIVKIPVAPNDRLTRNELKSLAQKYNVDYILLSDLTIFTLLREKMVTKKKGIDFTVKVRFGLFSQLIDPKTGAVLWAEPVVREMGQLNTKKKVKAAAYGYSAVGALKAGLVDLSDSIYAIGKEVRQ